MELRHVRYFLAVAEAGSFTRAAERLGVAQSALSLQIRDLEREVGARLFDRLPHGTVLSEAGHAFRQAVRLLPEQAAWAMGQARRAARGETGALRLGFTSSAILNPLVPRAIRAFRRRCPQVGVALEEGNSAHLSARLRDGALDLAFLRPDGGDESDLHLRPLPDESMVAAVPAGHPAGAPRRRRVALADLSEQAFILTPRPVGATLHDAVIAACRQAGFEPRLGPHAPQLASALALVAAELGVTVVPATMRQFAVAGVVYRDIVGVQPVARLSLAHPAAGPSATAANFVALALA